MKLIEAQQQLNRFLKSEKGERLREYKDKKLSAYLMMLDGFISDEEVEQVIEELRKRYFDVLQEQSYLVSVVEEAYHKSREVKAPQAPLIMKLLDGDHPDNPHRRLDEQS